MQRMRIVEKREAELWKTNKNLRRDEWRNRLKSIVLDDKVSVS